MNVPVAFRSASRSNSNKLACSNGGADGEANGGRGHLKNLEEEYETCERSSPH
jgi:hypothetical protein